MSITDVGAISISDCACLLHAKVRILAMRKWILHEIILWVMTSRTVALFVIVQSCVRHSTVICVIPSILSTTLRLLLKLVCYPWKVEALTAKDWWHLDADMDTLSSGRWTGNTCTTLTLTYGMTSFPQISSSLQFHASNYGGAETVITSLASTASTTSTSLVALQVRFGTVYRLR